MIVINGRIIDFLIDRDIKTGYVEFLFQSDYNKDIPRFQAICSCNIPDVVTGVPIKVEFRNEKIEEIKKINFKEDKIEKITKEIKNEYMNNLAYACVNYNDEEYARTLLIKVKGISDRTADKILEAVDGDISKLSEKWDDKDFWKGLRGSKRYLDELKNTVGSMFLKDLIVKHYGKYGIGYPQVELLMAEYGEDVEQKILFNPYQIAHKLELNFQVADNMAKDFGMSYLSHERLRAIIHNILTSNEQNGNTAMRIRDFYVNCARLHRFSAWKEFVVSPYCLLAEVMAMKSIYYADGLVGYISTLNMESDIAFHLLRLSESDSDLKTRDTKFEEIKDKYNEKQLEFLKEFNKNSVTVLLGRGGTGKTHTICGAIDLFRLQKPKEKIMLCAPTARAAGVLKEHSGYESSTIHVMLELSPYEDEAGKNEENQLEAGLIVVDEMSMVDTQLMWHLVKAIKSGTKVILSGDPDQLESVCAGAVLRDLIKSDALKVVKLKKIMRQSEGSAVIENCGRVLHGRYDFVSNENFNIRYCGTEEEAKAYLSASYEGDADTTQILSTTKKGIIGTMALNREFEDTEKEGVYIHGDYFSIGDKVIFTKNNYDADYCNGDIGFIESITMPLQVRKQDTNNIIEIDKEMTADMEHANAITIHKSQGSEYKKVYIVLPEQPKSLLTRNMINTAVSRAREKVVLIIVKDALKMAASNRYKKERLTRLCEQLTNAKKEKMEEALRCQGV